MGNLGESDSEGTERERSSAGGPTAVALRMNDARFEIPPVSTLIAFEATARLGGVSRAAGELNTSQSAISRHIRKLEGALGVSLFDRRSRNLVLTKSGEEYLATVQPSLRSLHAAGHGMRARGLSVRALE